MWPIVQYLIACDDVQADPNNLHRINIFGLITNIRSTVVPPFPVVRPLFCVLALMTRCQGSGELVLRIQHNATGRFVYRSPPRRIRFVGSPQDALGVVFRLRNCTFPEAGLYWVELFYSNSILARRSLRLYS
jgi:hypothetical protein